MTTSKPPRRQGVAGQSRYRRDANRTSPRRLPGDALSLYPRGANCEYPRRLRQRSTVNSAQSLNHRPASAAQVGDPLGTFDPTYEIETPATSAFPEWRLYVGRKKLIIMSSLLDRPKAMIRPSPFAAVATKRRADRRALPITISAGIPATSRTTRQGHPTRNQRCLSQRPDLGSSRRGTIQQR